MNILDTIITKNGTFNVGDKLIGERDASHKLGISRAELRKAQDELSIKGIISKEHGKVRVILKDIYTGEEET